MAATVAPRDVLVTGGTGYIGPRLIAALVRRGHRVRALARAASLARIPPGATPVIGNALDAASIAGALRPGDTLVQLVGTPHPGPGKARAFQAVDLVSVRAAVAAATRVGIAHFVYVGVAHPAPLMRAYVAVRVEGEALVARSGLPGTVVRPWYVLGPEHWWPVLLLPLYGIASLFPRSREGARRLGLVTLAQMVAALVQAVETPPSGPTLRILDVPAIRGAPPVA